MILEIIIYLVAGISGMIYFDNHNKTAFYVLSLSLIIIFMAFYSMHYVPQNSTVNIVYLEKTTGIEGSFILGSGSIGSVPVYYVYSQTEDGGYKLLELQDVIIYEQNESPRYDIETVCENNKKSTIFNWNLNPHCVTTKKLIVPPNTIIREFKG